jgi:hypothetical protein
LKHFGVELTLASGARLDTIAGSMAARSRVKAAGPRVVPDDLAAVVGEALAASPGIKSTQIKKALPKPYQPFAAEALAALRQLADGGGVEVIRKGATELFFPAEPLGVLDRAILGRVAAEALDKDALKDLATDAAPGYAVVFDDWLKSAIAGKRLYEHAPVPGSKKKRFSTEPDVRKTLGPLLAALPKVLLKAKAMGISKERVAAVLLSELGVAGLGGTAQSSGAAASREAPASNGAKTNGAQGRFLVALAELVAEKPAEALWPVRELRKRLPLAKEEFDALALQLMAQGAITLHHHDHPAAVPESERSQLVQDARGTHYIGIAPRRGT